MTNTKGFLNRNQLKYLVIAAMLIDHIAWAFVPTASLLAQVHHLCQQRRCLSKCLRNVVNENDRVYQIFQLVAVVSSC